MTFRGRLARVSQISSMTSPSIYDSWTKEQFIARIQALEASHNQTTDTKATQAPPKAKDPKSFDFGSYPKRKIALKFCYSGWAYNGLAFQADKTPLPTVEGTLFKALASCKLIDGDAGPEGCGWERCGRTDRGVSSAGQVVSLWVRSNVGQMENSDPGSSRGTESESDTGQIRQSTPDDELSEALQRSKVSTRPRQEIRYVSILNRVLPSTIRILAWSRAHPDFSSRFNCQTRHYKYYFSPEGLDVELMREAAVRLVGEHDFRNLCKIDPSKQVTSYRRRITRADISGNESMDSSRICVFDLIGTAFLYNQVRHIMAILFLVGSGLEPPSVVTSLLNADPNFAEVPFREGDSQPELVECKPEYQMADPLPLVLWNCEYKKEDVSWEVDENEHGDVHDARSVYRHIHSAYEESLIRTALESCFLQAASKYHLRPVQPFPLPPDALLNMKAQGASDYFNIPLGGGATRRTRANLYVPLLQRKRLEHVDVVNERWRLGKGERRSQQKRLEGHAE